MKAKKARENNAGEADSKIVFLKVKLSHLSEELRCISEKRETLAKEIERSNHEMERIYAQMVLCHEFLDNLKKKKKTVKK